MVDDEQTSGTASGEAPMQVLVVAFRGALPPDPDRSGWDDGVLGRVLHTVCGRAGEAWPALDLPAGALVADLARRLGPGVTAPEQILELALVDLALAAACRLGRPGAVEAFEAHHGRDIGDALARMAVTEEIRREAGQRVRQRLFFPEAGAAAAIGQFSGQGDLRSWLKVLAVREALMMLRKGQQEVALEEHLEVVEEAVAAGGGPAGDPEMDHLRRHYSHEFKAAFGQALEGLTPRERNLLRHQVIDRLTVDQVGTLLGVHRATAARWMEKAREALASATRAALRERLRVGRFELESILQLVDSQVDMSVQRLLGDAGDTD